MWNLSVYFLSSNAIDRESSRNEERQRAPPWSVLVERMQV